VSASPPHASIPTRSGMRRRDPKRWVPTPCQGQRANSVFPADSSGSNIRECSLFLDKCSQVGRAVPAFSPHPALHRAPQDGGRGPPYSTANPFAAASQCVWRLRTFMISQPRRLTVKHFPSLASSSRPQVQRTWATRRDGGHDDRRANIEGDAIIDYPPAIPSPVPSTQPQVVTRGDD